MRKFLLMSMLIPLFAFGQTTITVDGINYQLNDNGTATVTGGGDKDATTKLDIPAQVKNGDKSYNVTTIGMRAFSGYSALLTVKLPETVTVIEK